MKNLYKRIITVFLAVVTLFFSCVPCAYASGWEVLLSVPGDFWDWAVSSYYSSTENPFLSLFDKSVCPHCPDVTRRHNFKEQRTTVDGKTSLYYICEYCGKSAGEVGEEAYQQQVSELPAPGYGSDGGLLIPIQIKYHKASGSYYGYQSCSEHTVSSKDVSRYTIYFLCDTNSISFRLNSGYSEFSKIGYTYDISFTFPYDGYYSFLLPAPTISYVTPSGENGLKVGTGINTFTSPVFYTAGKVYNYSNSYVSLPDEIKLFSAVATVETPLAKYNPAPSSDLNFENQYNITTRPTTITGGNYGIIGDGNQITTITDNRQIINEGDNIYYNPATGQTYTITDWTYNYDGRIYNITLDTGDTVSVEYGDENITIVENTVNEGDTIVNNYTIYYMIDGSGSGDNPDPSPDPGPTATTCPHAWAETSRTDPTCISPGSVSFSCSKCGETKTDKLPATGHIWQVLRTVQTAYDEEGNLVQQGYTIYQCAICSEQYKDDQGTGPPGGGDKDDDKETIWDKIASFFGSIVDGIAGIFEAILGKLLDALTALSELLMGKVKDVVEVVLSVLDEIPALFDGFLNFLALIFPFLPPEITLLLTFGVIAVVFIGIIKAIRR